MLVSVEAGHTVPTREAGYDVGQSGGRPHGTTRRLAMMLVRVEAGRTVLPERLAMMLVAVEEGHVVGHVLSI